MTPTSISTSPRQGVKLYLYHPETEDRIVVRSFCTRLTGTIVPWRCVYRPRNWWILSNPRSELPDDPEFMAPVQAVSITGDLCPVRRPKPPVEAVRIPQMTASQIPTFVVANRTGGQGKTLVSQVIHFGYLLAGHKLHVGGGGFLEGGGRQVKIGQIMDNSRVCPIQVEELGIGASMDKIKDDARSAIKYWDTIGAHLKGGATVIDLGANILPQVLEWAKQRKASRLLAKSDIVLVVPVTAQRQSIIDALQMINEARHAESELRFQTIYVVFNGYHGSFKTWRRRRRWRSSWISFATRCDAHRHEALHDGGVGARRGELHVARRPGAVGPRSLRQGFRPQRIRGQRAHVEFVDWLSETPQRLPRRRPPSPGLWLRTHSNRQLKLPWCKFGRLKIWTGSRVRPVPARAPHGATPHAARRDHRCGPWTGAHPISTRSLRRSTIGIATISSMRFLSF